MGTGRGASPRCLPARHPPILLLDAVGGVVAVARAARGEEGRLCLSYRQPLERRHARREGCTTAPASSRMRCAVLDPFRSVGTDV